MRLLVLTDRLSARGGADAHLMQVVDWAVRCGYDLTLAFGRLDPSGRVPDKVKAVRVKGLSSMVDSTARLDRLDRLLPGAEVVHVQNVMNPEALRRVTATGRAVVTVQDHRVFCPGQGKTLPDGGRCDVPFEVADCSECLPDEQYRDRMIRLTQARRDALVGSRPIVLSRYMAEEVAAAGLAAATVVPPWFLTGNRRKSPGQRFVLGGRLVAHKGVIFGYKGWLQAGRPLPLRVAGDGPVANDLDRCEKLGWIDGEALRHELRSARALLFPVQWQEPFGMLAVEALAQGTPVITTDVGGVGEWSDAGCIQVPAGDHLEFAAAISRLAGDADLAVRLGEKGRRMVVRRFSERRIAPLLQAVYARAMRG